MHKLYELKEKLMKELEEYSQNGKFSEKDVEAIKYITSAIDHICNIMEDMEEYSEYDGQGGGMGGSSRRGGSSYERGRGGSSRRDGSYYDGGSSYARGRGRNARRDSMGRYSRRDGGSSYGNEMMVDELRELMEEAPDERTRMEFEKFIGKMEQM